MQKKTRTRIGSILLCMAMLLSLLPVTAGAIGDEGVGGPGTGISVMGNKDEYATIAAALEADETSIKLIADLTENVVIPSGKTVSLDLNNNTLTNDATGNAADTIYVELGGQLTITGSGTVDNVSHAKAAIFNNGTVILNGGNYTRSEENGQNKNESGDNSYYNIVNHGVMTINSGVSVTQNGHFSSLVENGYYNYASNDSRFGYVDGTNSQAPEMTIHGGTFSGGINTIKNDDGAELTINNGDFSNYTQAVVQNHNITTINGGTFTAGEASTATYGVDNCGCAADIDVGTLTINGGTFTGATYGVYERSSLSTTVVTITGGDINGTSAALKKSGSNATFDVAGGTFSSSVSDYVAPNYECVGPNDNGKYTVQKLKDKLVVSGSVGDDGNVSGTLTGEVGSSGAAVGDSPDNDITGNNTTTIPSKNVTISLTTGTDGAAGNATTTTLEVTQETAQSLDNANSLTVKTDAADVSFDNTALSTIADKATAAVTITVKDTSTTSSTEGVKASYEVSVTAGGKDLLPDGGANNGTVTITVPVPQGVTDTTKLTAWYVQDGVYVTNLGGEVKDSSFVFSINHLSEIYITDGTITSSVVASCIGSDSKIHYYNNLADAIQNAVSGTTVKLENDTKFDTTINITGKTITLDLNGHTATFTGDTSKYAIELSNNAKLIIDDSKTGGELISTTYRVIKVGDASIKTTGTAASLTLNGGTVSSEYSSYNSSSKETDHGAIAVYANSSGDHSEGKSVACTVEVNNATVNGGIYVFGQGAELTVNNGAKITSKGYAISGNGSVGGSQNCGGTKVTINGGTIKQTGGTTGQVNTAIYHPQVGTLTINGGTITSDNTAIEIRAGVLTVEEGAVIRGGEGEPINNPNGNGTTTTNTGIAIAQHTTKQPITVNINGGTISGGAAVYESNPQNNGGSNAVTVNVKNATLNGNVNTTGFGNIAMTNVEITGNVNNQVGEVTSSGKMSIVNSTITGTAPTTDVTIVNSMVDGTLTNTIPSGAVALVGSKTYNTLQAAIDGATDGDTITLLTDIDQLGQLTGTTSGSNISLLKIDKNITIMGNGKKISITIPEDATNRSEAVQVTTGTTATLDGVSLTITGKSTETDKGDAFDMYGELKVVNNSNISINGVANGFVMQGGKAAKINVADSSITAQTIKGHFSNGGVWDIKDSTVSIADCGTHGLSVEEISIDNSAVTVDGAKYLGIYGSKIEILNGANVTVKNSGNSLNSTAYADKGTVQIKNDTGSLTVTNSTLTLSGNKNGAAENEQTIYVGDGDLNITNSSVSGQIRQSETAASRLVTVMDRGTLLEQKTVSGSYTLPNAPSNPGYTFLGWYLNGTRVGGAGDSYTVTADVTLEARWQVISSTPDTPSYDSGSSEPSGDYIVSVDRVSGGKVTVNPGRADKGDEVTVTVKPSEGYELDELVVTDSKGNEVRVYAESSTKFTFTMPSGTVDVKASFVKIDAGSVLDDFADLNPNAWYAEAVEFVIEEGLMTGTSAAAFAPDASMSRAMIWTVLAAYNGYNTSGGNPWYAPGQQWAMINGVSDGTSPDGSITREQLAVMLWRAAGSPETDKSLSGYADASSVSDWAETAMAWAVDNGIITGMGGSSLAPQATATRAQVAVMLMQFVDYMED